MIRLSGINQRRWALFKANRRGFWSSWIFLALFGLSLLAPVIANDRPVVVSYKGQLFYPAYVESPEQNFVEDGFQATTDFKDPYIRDSIEKDGWMLWPPVRYTFNRKNNEIPSPAPSPPAWRLTWEEACKKYEQGVNDPNCTAGNMNWLGTDDQARDVVARLIYGFRISVAFGLILTILSSIVGVAAGATQGYFGGWTDLIFQRFIEIWNSVPTLYILIIIAAIIQPSFWILMFILLPFSWTGLTGLVRAEFLRARNFEYVRAARAMGLGNIRIMWKHILPNAVVSTMTFMPFILSGSLTVLTSLDYLGFGLPPGSASLGELMLQGKSNLHAPWLAITGFIVISSMLTLLVFAGEAIRDAYDPRKTLR